MEDSSQNINSQDPIKLGVIGCSLSHAKYHSALMSLPDIKVTALTDPNKNEAKAWARELRNRPAICDDISDLLAQPLDGVLITTPLLDRSQAVADALRSDIPVLVELPFATDLATMDDLIALSVHRNVALVPALPRRFDPWVSQMTRLVQEGEIGSILHTRCTWAWPFEQAPLWLHPDTGGWNLVMQNMISEAIDLCNLWQGDVYSVSADINAPLLVETRMYGAGVHAEAMLASVITGHQDGQATLQLMRTRAVRQDERYLLTGSRGQAELTVSAGPTSDPAPRLVLQRAGETAHTIRPLGVSEYQQDTPSLRLGRMLQNFVKIVRGEETDSVPLPLVRSLLEVVHASFVSTCEQTKVVLPMRRTPKLFDLLHSMQAVPRELPPAPRA